MRRRSLFLVGLLLVLAGPVAAQKEGRIASDFRREGESFKEGCGKLKPIGCGEVLFTGQPLHIAVGSIAPQNGVGFGPAFVEHWSPSDWRVKVNADAIVSTNGSWRAGVYAKAIYAGIPSGSIEVRPAPVLNFYAQAISLNKIAYYGLGQNTSRADLTYFGMRETIAGASVVYPFSKSVFKALNLALLGEANGRFVDIRRDREKSAPSIEQVYGEATAPGLTSQPAFAQFGEGVRVRPVLFDNGLRLNYSVNYQQFVAGDSRSSFQRLTVDLAHQIPLYRKTRNLLPREHAGPDDCSISASDNDHKCPKVTRDREGSINLRLLLTQSFVPDGHAVPFYFQPTLGGSDINGKPTLASYQDYRFRAPNLLLLQGSIEHSLYGPLGVIFLAETGRVALRRSDLEFKHLAHSYAAGLTLRAGGFPMVNLMFAWGGHEGTHNIVSMNSSLLGGSARPSLY
jgi:hypothetical protein